MADNELIQLPISFYVAGNLIPATLAALADTTPFTASNCTISIQTARTIEGHSLKPVRVVPAW